MKLRARISIDIQPGIISEGTTPALLKSLYGPAIARAIASGLPDEIKVDNVTVTRLNIAQENAPSEE